MADRYVPAAGRAVFTPVYDAVNAVTMREGRWRTGGGTLELIRGQA